MSSAGEDISVHCTRNLSQYVVRPRSNKKSSLSEEILEHCIDNLTKLEHFILSDEKASLSEKTSVHSTGGLNNFKDRSLNDVEASSDEGLSKYKGRLRSDNKSSNLLENFVCVYPDTKIDRAAIGNPIWARISLYTVLENYRNTRILH